MISIYKKFIKFFKEILMIETNLRSYSLSRDHSLESLKRSPRRKYASNSHRRRTRSRSRHRSRSRSRLRSKYIRKRSPFPRPSRYRVDSREEANRFNPAKNDIIAVFGLDRDTTESDLFNFYKKYGCKRCKVIFDKRVKNLN